MSFIRICWIEFRRSVLFWATIPLLLAQIAGMTFGASDWVGEWSGSSLAITWPSMIVGPGLAGCAAMTAVSRSLRGPKILANSAVSRLRLEAALLVGPLIVAFVCVLVGVIYAYLRSYPIASQGPGSLRFGYAAIALSFSILSVALGHVCGRLVRSWWVVPVTVFLALGLAITVTHADGPAFITVLAPLSTALAPSAVVLPAAMAAAGLVVAFAVGIMVGHQNRRSWSAIAAAVGGLAMMGAAVAVLAGTTPHAVRTDPVEELCTESQPMICVFAEARRLEPMLSEYADHMAALPEPLVVPDRFVQIGLKGADVGDFAAELGRWPIANIFASRVWDASSIGCPTAGLSGEKLQEVETARVTIIEWLTARIYGSERPAGTGSTADALIDFAKLAEVLDSDEGQQAAWLQGEIDAVAQACQR